MRQLIISAVQFHLFHSQMVIIDGRPLRVLSVRKNSRDPLLTTISPITEEVIQ